MFMQDGGRSQEYWVRVNDVATACEAAALSHGKIGPNLSE